MEIRCSTVSARLEACLEIGHVSAANGGQLLAHHLGTGLVEPIGDGFTGKITILGSLGGLTEWLHTEGVA